MNVLILNQSFYPDVVSVAQHAADFAADLAAAGHSVTVVASARAYENPSVRFPARETWRGCSIRRVGGTAFGKAHKWGRLVDCITLLLAFAWELFRLPRFDVMIAMTHPPLVAVFAAVVARVKQSRLISWVMDLNPDQAIAAGWLPAGSGAARILSAALRFSLRASDRIVVLDRFMRDRIAAKGIAPGKIEIIPPWSHDADVRYDSAGRAFFRAAHGLTGKFVVMYAGNLSIVHPVTTLLDAAALLRDRDDIVFCFIGGGVGRQEVEARGLSNIVLLPYQPLNRLSAALSAADLHAVVMGDAMPGIVHPCKIYNVLAVGAPFLYIGPRASHVGEIVGSLLTPGAAYDVRHGDPSAAAAAIALAAFRSRRAIPELLTAARPFSHTVLAPRFARVVCGGAPAMEPIPFPGHSSFPAGVERALRAASPDVLILQFDCSDSAPRIEMLWERLLMEATDCGIRRTILLSPFPCADPLVMSHRRRSGVVYAEIARRHGYEYIDLLDALPAGRHEVIANAIANYLCGSPLIADMAVKVSGVPALPGARSFL